MIRMDTGSFCIGGVLQGRRGPGSAEASDDRSGPGTRANGGSARPWGGAR
jgi:hypothetical protein